MLEVSSSNASFTDPHKKSEATLLQYLERDVFGFLIFLPTRSGRGPQVNYDGVLEARNLAGSYCDHGLAFELFSNIFHRKKMLCVVATLSCVSHLHFFSSSSDYDAREKMGTFFFAVFSCFLTFYSMSKFGRKMKM